MFGARKAVIGKAQVKRVVIVGFDGMDPELANRFMGEGKLPNLAKLRDQRDLSSLRTQFPRFLRSAWSPFQTGVNPGKHNIYDFLARDLKNYLPPSSAQISEPSATCTSASTRCRSASSEVKGLRRERLSGIAGQGGVFCS